MKYGELGGHLNGVLAGDGKLGAVYVVAGSDDYLRSEAVKLFRAFVEPEFADFNFSRFSSEDGVADAIETLHTYPVFGQYRVVVLGVAQKLADEDKKSIKAYIDSPDDTSVFVIDCDADAAKSFKGKSVETVDCNALKEEELAKEVKKICAIPPSVEIEAGAIAELENRTQGEMARIASEIVKLKSYCDGVITRADVCDMVTADFDFQLYALSDAVSKKDADKAFRVLDSFYKNGIRSMRILNQLHDKYRKMLHAELSKGLSNDEIGELLSMSGHAVYYLRQASGAYSQVRLKKCVDCLNALQYDVLSGRKSENTALNEAMFELLLI